ncbi:uracil-DNA glycosylase [Cochlodiniinecator piscidefendens]|uniref:uracil-DNA glycosylase n=1 Tax=Cochlodiniinecator piscidefendens TaxID=2715756 RepID=UPI0014090B14|nr:uracil-DNA glycosylase [Cochlodiniinecator piscidefendens]
MDGTQDFYALKAMLDWQVEMGVTDAICDDPVDRYEVPAEAPKIASVQKAKTESAPPVPEAPDPAVIAKEVAENVGALDGLAATLKAFDLCEIKRGARNFVFADGNPLARVMIIGEAPGRDEDMAGRPFVGRAGQLLDKMFGAIDMGRDAVDAEKSIYITNILPWRPPQNRDPSPEEIAMMRPFVERHVELAQPGVIVLMGNVSCQAILGKRGITRLRGQWAEAFGKPCLPMFHPAYLLRNPAAKREAWHDLLMLREKLKG